MSKVLLRLGRWGRIVEEGEVGGELCLNAIATTAAGWVTTKRGVGDYSGGGGPGDVVGGLKGEGLSWLVLFEVEKIAAGESLAVVAEVE